MEVSSKQQLFVFMVYIASGMGCGVFFDVQRSIRKVFSAGKIRTLLEDILFAFVCIAGTIIASFIFNRGEMRYYQIMGLISGVLFYAAFLSPYAMKTLIALNRALRKFIINPIIVIVKIVLSPFKKINLFLKKKYRKIKMCFLKAVRRIKTVKNKVKKRMKML